MSPAAMTRAMETLGLALVEMRQAPDPRVDLEVALEERAHLGRQERGDVHAVGDVPDRGLAVG